MNSKFPSLKHAPAETRATLRERFARTLRINNVPRLPDNIPPAPDELLLQLLQQIVISGFSEQVQARTYYESIAKDQPSALPFDQILEQGWFDLIWGRLHSVAFHMQPGILRGAPPELTLLKDLLYQTFKAHYQIPDALQATPELAVFIEQFRQDQVPLGNIPKSSTVWMAGRLWEQAPGVPEPVLQLKWWADRWALIGNPDLVPTAAWDQPNATRFQDAVLAMAADPTVFVGWEQYRARLVKHIRLFAEINAESHVGVVPDTVVDRYLWLRNRRIERGLYASLDSCKERFGLVRVALGVPIHADFGQEPLEIAQTILGLALDRPELLGFIGFFIQAWPRFVADLAMFPQTSALACLLVADWSQHRGGIFDRAIQESEIGVDRRSAFTDACSMLGHWLESEAIAPGEVAALLEWMYAHAHGHDDVDVECQQGMLQVLRAVLTEQKSGILREVGAALLHSSGNKGLGTAPFTAFLDLLTLADLEETPEFREAIAQYLDSLNSDRYGLSGEDVTPAAARALAQLARRAGSKEWEAFLAPIKVKRLFARGMAAKQNNDIIVKNDICRSVRAQIRVLSRAIVGFGSACPPELVDALGLAVRSGAADAIDNGQVAAFSPDTFKLISNSRLEPPIASDLAGALRKLNEAQGSALADKIVLTDEPILLAELMRSAPRSYRPRFDRRLSQLVPDKAGKVWSLLDTRARIEALLNAEKLDLALKYINWEYDAAPQDRPIPGRALATFRDRLRVLQLSEDWNSILAASVPSRLNQGDNEAAQEALAFFQGLAQLQSGRDPEGAADAFRILLSKRPHVIAYFQNYFAARLAGLLREDHFRLLRDDEAKRGRQYLRDAESRAAELFKEDSQDRGPYDLNRGLLLLALGDPEAAYAAVLTVKLEAYQPVVFAYSAVALWRMGRHEEASAAIDSAIREFGEEPVLRAASSHIKSGAVTTVAVMVERNPREVESTRSAFLSVKHMNAYDQAGVVSPGGKLSDLIFEEMRISCQSFVGLGPRMKEYLKSTKEDDVSAWIVKMLGARVSYLGWSVHFQEERGYSEKGNAGKPDIFLEHRQTALAMIEAVVFDDPLTRQATLNDLASHAQKLLGYGDCSTYCHLIYCYRKPDTKALLAELGHIARTCQPDDVAFLGIRPLGDFAELPQGFVAIYERDGRMLEVMYLVLDLDQSGLIEAAATGGATKKNRGGKRPTALALKKAKAHKRPMATEPDGKAAKRPRSAKALAKKVR